MYRLRGPGGHPNCFVKYFHSLNHSLFGDSKWRTNLDRCIAKAERRKKQKTSDKALIGDFGRHFAVGFVGSRLYDMNPSNQTFAVDGPNSVMIEL